MSAQSRWALNHAGRETEMRGELTRAVAGLFASRLNEPRRLDHEERERLVRLAVFTARARSSVERDGYTRGIELIPAPEAPTRLVIVLDRLLAGLDTIGTPRADAWAVVTRCALDSIPALRRDCISYLIQRDDEETSSTIGEALGYPTTTTRRALEELHAHGLIERKAVRENLHAWKPNTWTREAYAGIASVPETSEPLYSSLLCIGGDTSGTLAASPNGTVSVSDPLAVQP